jgi:hypothetical protein
MPVDKNIMDILNKAALPYQVGLHSIVMCPLTSSRPCNHFSPQVVLTKTDCVSKREVIVAAQSVFDEINNRNRHGCHMTIHAVSAESGDGLQTLKRDIAEAVYMDFRGSPPPLATEV